jgi:prolyl-tRNA synthetase
MEKNKTDKKEIFELKSNQLTATKENLSEWYNQLMLLADIVDDRYAVKGMAVWKPYGYKIMQNIKKRWDELFQNAGIQEVYFPLIVPIEYCEQNPSWWKGFKSEGFKVIAGTDNKIQGIIRPTGEPAIYPMYSMWVRSKNDLPIRFYETVNSYRYETKSTRPLIRTREISVWHEIHTAHATREEAEEEFKLHMKLWDELWKDLALPPFKVVKPIWECFPGAIGAVEYYSTTPTGRVMENGSVNNLGQAYAKKFNIKFKNEKGNEEYAWQICTGNGARLLGGLILVHGDNKGLIIPPKIAPIKVVIVPILFKGKERIVLEKAKELSRELEGFDIYLDERKEKTAGEKFYEWEIKGVPLRIEIGPKDIEKNSFILVRRDTGKKEIILNKEAKKKVKETLEDIQNSLLKKATEMLNSQIKDAKTLEEVKSNLKSGKISRVFWCKDGSCYDKISETAEGLEGFGSEIEEKEEGNCIICNKKTKTKLYLARTY